MRRRLALLALLLAACTSSPLGPPAGRGAGSAGLAPDVEAISFLGGQLKRQRITGETLAKRTQELEAAQREYEKNPNDADAIIWLGRRTAYLGRYRDAIDIFTDGIRKHPNDARLYRHRGHRYISVRNLDLAIADLQRAQELTRNQPDEIEPDGLPNARNTPIGSLQSNICYHLGLALYLKGDFERALPIYQRCNELSTNPDRLVSTTHWLYMTLRRLGRAADAEKVLEPISTSMDIIENAGYHKLTLMYRGEIAPEELLREDPATTEGATILYGVGNWYLYNGQPDRAREIYRSILQGGQWAAFGYIAAEADLARP